MIEEKAAMTEASPLPTEWELNNPVHIKSDGTGPGTYVMLPDGTELRGMTAVTFEVTARDFTRAVLHMQVPSVYVDAEVSEITFTCPTCKGCVTHTHAANGAG